MNTISEVIWIASSDLSQIVYISPAYERVWGRSCESLYRDPLSFLEAVHPDDAERVRHVLTMQREGCPFDYEYRIVRDGEVRWIWDHGYPVRRPTGEVEHYVGVAQDISDRKRAERQVAELAERYELVSRATRDAIWDWDIASNTAWWSEQVYELLGYDRATVPGHHPWASRIHPDDRERVLASFSRAVENRSPLAWSEEYRFVIPGRPTAQVLDRAYLLLDDAGKPIRMVGALMNVTEQRNLELQLRHAQKMETLGLFAGGIAHDMNNILQMLSFQFLALENAHGMVGALVDDVREIRATLDRGVSLTRQLLIYSRRQRMNMQSIDLNAVVADLARMLRYIVGENISLRLELAPGVLPVVADAAILCQVIMNLAVNARDAMPRGGILVIASSIANHPGSANAKAGRYACIAVEDNGTGIAPDVLPRIFEPFFTTKEADCGTGLGLAITLGIVEQHGGFIEVDSATGKGTTFRTYLPIDAGRVNSPSQRAESKR